MKWLSDRAVERLREAAHAPDLSGTRYRPVERLGRGGMGTVYLAEDSALGRRLALKVLHDPDASGELAARLLREARILARLEHPGIVPVHDVGTLADGRAFYTMKYVQGARLDRHIQAVTALPDRLRIFQKICEAAAFAHAHGVLHRDLKPENVMVGPFGEVLVMDWGVAKILQAHRGTPSWTPAPNLTQAPAAAVAAETDEASIALPELPAETEHGAVLGTPGYMAPEQARGETQNLDQTADVFALGAILRFLLTGRAPDEGGMASIPKALGAICAKAMAQEPAGRYVTAQDLALDVARYLDGAPVEAYPENLFRKAGRLISRHRVAILLVTAYLVMRVLLLYFMGR